MSTKEKKSKAQHSTQELLSKFVSFISNYILIHTQPPPHPGGVTPHMKGVGRLVGNFEADRSGRGPSFV